MKNKELFDRTIGILVKAYQNGTLVNSICGCAVGNIIASNMGVLVTVNGRLAKWSKWHPEWNTVFSTMINGKQYINPDNYEGFAKEQIDSTGYIWQDLAKIENSFESARLSDDSMFNGLMSVVDTLMLIHEANETEIKQAKELFVL